MPSGSLFAPQADPLASSGIPVRVNEQRIYDLIRHHRGFADPISIGTLHVTTGMSERTIKGIVADLIVHHRVLIGASRQDPVGYFMVENEADRRIAAEPLKGQIIQMLRRLRVLNNKEQVREWLGQQLLEAGGE